MLISLWSPKGGAGTSVFVAACGHVLARRRPVRIADLDGDQPAILGLAGEPVPGLGAWLEAGVDAPAAALDRISVPVSSNLTLLPRGLSLPYDAPPEVGAALGVVLANDPMCTIADLSTASPPVLRAMVEVSDLAVMVVRDCYVALRAALRDPLLAGASGVIAMEETGRALGASEIRDVLGAEVLGVVPVRMPIARVIDAGVLASRMPEPLERAAKRFLGRIGLAEREGRAA
jgi:hypothetical protein